MKNDTHNNRDCNSDFRPPASRTQMTCSGFTLIELLVVIAIISLLVSILLPSLQKAKELAKLATCSSNLHHYGLAVNLYANDYDGSLPPCGVWSQYYPYLIMLKYSGTDDIKTDANGHGYLWNEKFLPNPLSFYCPSETAPTLSYDTYENPWWPTTTHPDPATSACRSGYYYFSREGSETEPVWGTKYLSHRNLSEVNAGSTAFCADTSVYTSSANAHDRQRVNVLYLDGGVSSWQNDGILDTLQGGLGYLSTVGVYLVFDDLDEER